jgi:hypothetical protein
MTNPEVPEPVWVLGSLSGELVGLAWFKVSAVILEAKDGPDLQTVPSPPPPVVLPPGSPTPPTEPPTGGTP